MTNEQTAYLIIGLMVYGFAYLTVGCGATGIWRHWALHKAGEFWEYNLDYGIRRYYSGLWYTMRYHNVLYSVFYIGLWPVAIPLQMMFMTKALKRMMMSEYYY